MVFIGVHEVYPAWTSPQTSKLDEFVDVVKNLHGPAFGVFSRQWSDRPSRLWSLDEDIAPEDSGSEFSEELEAASMKTQDGRMFSDEGR